MTRPLPNAAANSSHRVLDTRPQNAENTNRPVLNRPVLTPGEWLRAVGDVRAPFGFDRMPTVWG